MVLDYCRACLLFDCCIRMELEGEGLASEEEKREEVSGGVRWARLFFYYVKYFTFTALVPESC